MNIFYSSQPLSPIFKLKTTTASPIRKPSPKPTNSKTKSHKRFNSLTTIGKSENSEFDYRIKANDFISLRSPIETHK